VYVVNQEKKVEYRRVTVGMQEGNLRVIEEGLKPGEWVITNGLQRVRPGVEVDAQQAEMTAE
jgi:multidrug efflux pump subunit AcrA (membrane-fusion protein)